PRSAPLSQIRAPAGRLTTLSDTPVASRSLAAPIVPLATRAHAGTPSATAAMDPQRTMGRRSHAPSSAHVGGSKTTVNGSCTAVWLLLGWVWSQSLRRASHERHTERHTGVMNVKVG